MSDWWWLVLAAIVIVAVVAVVAMRRRSVVGPGRGAATGTRDYGDERETSRLGGMSDEDRAWETASLERNRKREDQEQPPRVD